MQMCGPAPAAYDCCRACPAAPSCPSSPAWPLRCASAGVMYCDAPISSFAPNSLGHQGSSTGLLPAKAQPAASAEPSADTTKNCNLRFIAIVPLKQYWLLGCRAALAPVDGAVLLRRMFVCQAPSPPYDTFRRDGLRCDSNCAMLRLSASLGNELCRFKLQSAEEHIEGAGQVRRSVRVSAFEREQLCGMHLCYFLRSRS